MKKLITICLLLATAFSVNAQTKEEMQDYITKSLSLKLVEYKISDMNSSMMINKIYFNDCVMDFKIIEKNGDDINSYTITIPISNVNDITMGKNAADFDVIEFRTS